MNNTLIAHAQTDIDAPITQVWQALIQPDKIKQYMFGTDTVSDWKVGAPIVWKGVWQGKPYEDKGTILKIEPERVLQYSHFSPLSGAEDVPKNYHTVTIELTEKSTGTHVHLSQDNNSSEQDRDHSQQNWSMMLDGLKQFLEK